MAEIDFKGLFKDVFNYEIPGGKVIIEPNPERINYSSRGAPYYATDYNGREMFLPVTLNGMVIPFAIVAMGWKKDIKSTPLKNRPGSVLELIGIENYVITVKGLLINDDDTFPENGMIEMFKMFSINQSITIRNVMTDILLSGRSNSENMIDPYGHLVTIRDIQWPAIPGVEHAKPFILNLESDRIFDLYKKIKP